MLRLPFRRSARVCGIIIDIGSGSVGACVVCSEDQSERPSVLYAHREFMPVRSNPSETERIRLMRHTLFTVLMEVAQKGSAALRARGIKAPFSRVMVSCSAPWSHTVTQVIHFARPEGFTVTPALIDEIIAQAYAEEQKHAPHADSELAKAGMQAVERSIVDMSLNGYSVEDPYGKMATELDVTHLRGFVPESICTALADIREHTLSDMPTHIHTSALILYCVLRDLYPSIDDALIVEVTGEATECSLMHNDVLYEAAHIPRGMYTLTRDVAAHFKTIPEEARTYLRAYKQDALISAHEKALQGIQKKYIDALACTFDLLAVQYALPHTVFFVIEEDMQPFFAEAIQAALAGKSGIDERTLIPITPAAAARFADTAEMHKQDPRLALMARFFHKLHACGEITNR